MNAEQYLNEIDYNNTPVHGERFDDLDIADLSDILEAYAEQRVLKVLKNMREYNNELFELASNNCNGLAHDELHEIVEKYEQPK